MSARIKQRILRKGETLCIARSTWSTWICQRAQNYLYNGNYFLQDDCMIRIFSKTGNKIDLHFLHLIFGILWICEQSTQQVMAGFPALGKNYFFWPSWMEIPVGEVEETFLPEGRKSNHDLYQDQNWATDIVQPQNTSLWKNQIEILFFVSLTKANLRVIGGRHVHVCVPADLQENIYTRFWDTIMKLSSLQ